MDVRVLDAIRAVDELWGVFARREEYESCALDEYGRFSSSSSKHGPPLEPLVSKYLWKQGFKAVYPHNSDFAVCLTHDVDLLKPHSIRHLRIPRPAKYFLMKTSRKFETAWNFRRIIELEESFGAKSTFFFLALDRNDVDFNYDCSEIESEMRMITRSGWEIGLHGSRKASVDLRQMKAEKARLERAIGRQVLGYRNHYMLIRIPTTWRMLDEAGFLYDSTLGYADSVGFRNGMCHPFRPYDLEQGRLLNLLEIPLIVMDGSLFTYMRLGETQAWDMTRRMIDEVAAINGVFTILWHNRLVRGQPSGFYERVLEYCYDKGAWMTCGEEIRKWWEANGLLKKD